MTMERNQLAVALFVASEVVFFAALIIAYLTLQHGMTISAAEVLDVPLTAVFSVALFASSGTVWLASRRAEHDDSRGAALWLAATVILGLIFLGGQAFEYSSLFAEGITISTGLFGSAFFTLTGFHGAHLIGGVIALAILLGIALRGGLTRHRRASLEAVSLYWHFVDVVWVFIFGIVYIGALLRA